MTKQPTDLMKVVIHIVFERQVAEIPGMRLYFIQETVKKMFAGDKIVPNIDATKVGFMLKNITNLDDPGFHENYHLPWNAFEPSMPPEIVPPPSVEPEKPKPYNVYVEIGMTDSMEPFDPSEVTTDYDITPFDR